MVEIFCCECGAKCGEVSEETYGYIGTATLCDTCDQRLLNEILNG